VSLERGLLSLVRIIEELFQGNSGSGLENRAAVAQSVGIVRLRTQAMEFSSEDEILKTNSNIQALII
jgi:hypothetical protein